MATSFRIPRDLNASKQKHIRPLLFILDVDQPHNNMNKCGDGNADASLELHKQVKRYVSGRLGVTQFVGKMQEMRFGHVVMSSADSIELYDCVESHEKPKVQ